MQYILLILLLIVGYATCIEGQTNPDQIIKNLEARMFAVEILPSGLTNTLYLDINNFPKEQAPTEKIENLSIQLTSEFG